MTWRVRRADVDFFVQDLWKDLRPFPSIADEGVFGKDCFEEQDAQLEASILLLLRDNIGVGYFPKPVEIRGSVLIMERIRGIRLFDLIRHLKTLEFERRDGKAVLAVNHLLQRTRHRLSLVQTYLHSVGPIYSRKPYPLENKLRGLLELFIRVMDLHDIPEPWTRELEDFADYWEAECSIVPFRDATTKNMIIADNRFAVSSTSIDVESEQHNIVRKLLENEQNTYWSNVPLLDIDFSSIVHLTAPEDDPISLYCHEWTYGSCPILAQEFMLVPLLGDINPYRCAAAFLVRYLRFGGRKLAYKLINAQGFSIRFAYDDPLFYFDRLPSICSSLSPEFCADYSSLLTVVSKIAHAGRNPSPADSAQMSVDHLLKYYPDRHASYWQQNPQTP